VSGGNRAVWIQEKEEIGRRWQNNEPNPAAQRIGAAAQSDWQALPKRVILDWDSTAQSKHGHRQGVECGAGKPQARTGILSQKQQHSCHHRVAQSPRHIHTTPD
jgi:hypothetical protein